MRIVLPGGTGQLGGILARHFRARGDEVAGVVNLASPEPLPQREYMARLRDAWGTWLGLPTTRWMLDAGAVLLRTETELVLKSRRVVPTRLLEAGFAFEQPSWGPAAADLVARWRAARAAERGAA